MIVRQRLHLPRKTKSDEVMNGGRETAIVAESIHRYDYGEARTWPLCGAIDARTASKDGSALLW